MSKRLNEFLGPVPKWVVCIDCGQLFDQTDDEARCPASDGTAYHRCEEGR